VAITLIRLDVAIAVRIHFIVNTIWKMVINHGRFWGSRLSDNEIEWHLGFAGCFLLGETIGSEKRHWLTNSSCRFWGNLAGQHEIEIPSK
jgi:hypothetical protein